ncbi:MAG: hypothetical protein IKZ17_01335 [Bacteroidaceae bacterium]|nr:hypothetical protein [Bacteroidaceae bacterium]
MNNFANALQTIANTRNLSMQKVLTPADSLTLRNALLSLRVPAYVVWSTRFNSAANATAVKVDMSPLYTATKALCDLLGEINGATLHAENLVEFIVAAAHRVLKEDVSVEMCKTRALLKAAKEAVESDPTDERVQKYEQLKEECHIMENTPGNCKDAHTMATESTFLRIISRELGSIIDKQQAKSAEQVQAEEAERKAKLKAATKARKAAKAKAAK